jgi:hypothetical protein
MLKRYNNITACKSASFQLCRYILYLFIEIERSRFTGTGMLFRNKARVQGTRICKLAPFEKVPCEKVPRKSSPEKLPRKSSLEKVPSKKCPQKSYPENVASK